MKLLVARFEAAYAQDPRDAIALRYRVEITHHYDKVLWPSSLSYPVYHVLHLMESNLLLLDKVVQVKVYNMDPLAVCKDKFDPLGIEKGTKMEDLVFDNLRMLMQGSGM